MPSQTQSRFFLTRQSATILEDLHRRLKQAGSISLLHGARGTGKSRLLKQFSNRIAHENSVFVQFDSNHSFVVNGENEFSAELFFNQVIANLKAGSTLLIDQFDNAPAELQQKFVKFWSLGALDKNLKLVISVQRNSLQQLKDLSKRFHLQIESVELKPLSHQEQLEYLRSSCCPETRQVAGVSPELTRNLKLTNGIFSQLEAFRSHHGTEINCVDMSVSSQVKLKSLLLAVFSGLLILALSVFIFQNYGLDTGLLQEPVPPPENNAGITIPPKINTVMPVNEQKENFPVVAEKKSVYVDEITIADEIVDDAVKKQDSIDKQQHVLINNVQITLKEPLSESIEDEERDVVTDEQQNLTIFQQRIQATNLWLHSAKFNSLSIQLMTLSVDKNPRRALNRYLVKLKSKGVDLEQIKIYPFSKGGIQMFGVLYGEFDSLELAYKEIKRLPDVLKANKPFARTVKGIKDEVNGL